MAVLLALPAACQNQPQAAANVQPPAPAPDFNSMELSNDLANAEATVRRQLGNPTGLEITDAMAHSDGRITIVCGWLTRGGRDERFIVVDGRGAWIESGMRPGEMDRAVSEFCRPGPGRSMRRPS